MFCKLLFKFMNIHICTVFFFFQSLMFQVNDQESLPTMSFLSSFSCMNVGEHVFRHIPLSSMNLNGLIDLKNDIYDREDVPYTLGVYPADVHPDVESDNLFLQRNWIVNTDMSEKPGTHWQCVLFTQGVVKGSHKDEPCKNVKYYIIDSWGTRHVDIVTRDVLKTITKYRENADKVHRQCLRSSKAKKCSCQFEINFPITHCIQHSNFENCGWFALYFTKFSEDDLIQLLKTKRGQYGQIKKNYDNLINYFRNSFFKYVNTCKTFHEFKIKTEKNLKCPFKQICKNPHSYMMVTEFSDMYIGIPVKFFLLLLRLIMYIHTDFN